MRHGHGLRKLNRTSEHRLAMLRNMMNSLLQHEAIKTTLPKAKELRRVVEPMITLAKTPTLANKRLAFDRLRDRDMVVKLFAELGPRYQARPGRTSRRLDLRRRTINYLFYSRWPNTFVGHKRIFYFFFSYEPRYAAI